MSGFLGIPDQIDAALADTSAPSLRGRPYPGTPAADLAAASEPPAAPSLRGQPYPGAAPAGDTTLGNVMFNVGVTAQIGASIISQIGAYAGVQAQQAQLEAGAATEEHRAAMDDLGAAQARQAARTVAATTARTKGRYDLRAGQEQAAARVSAAARGVAPSGSAAEVQASLRYAQLIDNLTIDSNALNEKQALERQGLALSQRARAGRVSAANLRRSARALNPGLAAATAALQGLAGVGGAFAQRYR